MAENKVRILVEAQDQASAKIKEIGKSLEGVRNAGTSFSSSLSSSFWGVGASIASLAAMGAQASAVLAWAFAGFSLKSAVDLEQVSIAFETMIGDVGMAREVLGGLSKFAQETPFEFPEIAAAGKQLLAFGTAAGQLQPTLKMLGDIASGTSVPIGQLAYTFGQVQVAGRLMGQDLMQFTNAGVPLIQTLATQFGVSESAIKKMVEQGKIGFPDVQKALESLTGEGGKFFGMMTRQSQSLGGLFSTLKDSMGSLGREIIGISDTGEIRMGSMFESIRDGVAGMIEAIKENMSAILDFFSDLQNNVTAVFGSIVDLGKSVFDGIVWVFWPLFGWLGESLRNNGFQWKNIFTYISAGAVTVSTGLQLVFAWLLGSFKIISSAIWTTGKVVFNGLKLMLGAFLAPLEGAINGVIAGIRKIQSIMGSTQTDFVSFATDLGKSAIEGIGDGLAEWAGAIDESIAEMNASMASAIQSADAKLNSLSSNIGNGFEKVASPRIEWTVKNVKTLWGALDDAGKKGDSLASKVKQAAEKMESAFSSLTGKTETQKGKVEGLKKAYDDLKIKLKEVGEQGTKDLAKIDEQIAKSLSKIDEVKSGGEGDIAKRALAIQKEISDLNAKGDLGTEDQNTKKKLEEELKLAQVYVTQKQIADAKLESEKSETQLIYERTLKKMSEAEQERLDILKTREEKTLSILKESDDIKKQMEAKLALYKDEKREYGNLIAEKMNMDAVYFSAFGKKINEQINKTKEAIALVNQLGLSSGTSVAGLDGARANGWPVSSGGSYLVGERWPEIFVPRSPGTIIPNGAAQSINLNFGGVVISNQIDLDAFADRIKREIARSIELSNLWIS